jgi:hypothetical protein
MMVMVMVMVIKNQSTLATTQIDSFLSAEEANSLRRRSMHPVALSPSR